MKSLKKTILSAIGFLTAFGAAVALNVSHLIIEPPLYRELPGSGGVMEDISTQCTLTIPLVLCSILLPTENGKYWDDAAKTSPVGGYEQTEVFWMGS